MPREANAACQHCTILLVLQGAASTLFPLVNTQLSHTSVPDAMTNAIHSRLSISSLKSFVGVRDPSYADIVPVTSVPMYQNTPPHKKS